MIGKKWLFVFFILVGFSSLTYAQSSESSVKVSGAMSNVMRKGKLHGTILLDTISTKKHLYGLGPVEYLKGELLIIDGRSYVSSVGEDGSVKMEETYSVKAPFFVYTNTENWKEYKLPKRVRTLKQLEEFIDKKSKKIKRPFAFKLEGTFSEVNYHIQNLPDGTVVKSPKDAHQGQGKYVRNDVKGDIIGFFSTEHQTVFTHHDTYIHIHFINSERTETCLVKDLCTSRKGGREIDRSQYADAVEENHQRYKENTQLYRKRQEINEHIFGTIKRKWGYNYTDLVGLEKVNGEHSLIMLVYNIKRSINILGVPYLIAKLQAWNSPFKRKAWLFIKMTYLKLFLSQISFGTNPNTTKFRLA